MNKFTDQEYKIYENLAQAKSILRKNNGSIEDDEFLQIVDTTGKDGWTGLLTRFVYKDGVDLEEVLSLYSDLKNSKLNLGKLNKMSYDDIVDEIYSQSNTKGDDNIDFVAKVNDYLIFHIKSYDANLKICSPSWCIKTKNFWDQYSYKAFQFVIIKERYANKRGKTKLLTPSSTAYFGSYKNVKDASVRYGVTYRSPQSVDIFNDNNKITSLPDGIMLEIENYVKGNNDWFFKSFDRNFEHGREIIFSFIQDESKISSSWDLSINAGSPIDYEEEFQKFLQFCSERGLDPFEFYKKYERDLFNDPILTTCCGIADYILYRISGNKSHDEGGIPLSGMWLKERELSSSSYKYIYGFAQNKYGLMYIMQSYDSISEWYEMILLDFTLVFLDVSESSLMASSALSMDGMGDLYQSWGTNFLNMLLTFFHGNAFVNEGDTHIDFFIDQFIETIHNYIKISSEFPEFSIDDEESLEDIKNLYYNQLVSKSKVTSQNRLDHFIDYTPPMDYIFDNETIKDILNIDREKVIKFFETALGIDPNNIDKYNTTTLTMEKNVTSSEKSDEVLRIRFWYKPVEYIPIENRKEE